MRYERLIKVVKEKGELLNFNIGIYQNETDSEGSKKAREVVKEFMRTFALYCENENLQLDAGIAEFPAVGQASFISVKQKEDGKTLMAFMVPHDIIDVQEEEPDE